MTDIEQIRRAHASAEPKQSNPAWVNCHRDCGVLLAEIERMRPYFDAIDDEAVVTFTLNKQYSPREQLAAIIEWHIQVATDPSVNGGYELRKVTSSPSPDPDTSD